MTDRFRSFLGALRDEPALGEGLAVAHGSGPGVMQAVDDAAHELGVFRLGVGIDAEAIGQAPNMAPEALVQFKSPGHEHPARTSWTAAPSSRSSTWAASAPAMRSTWP